MIFNTLKKHASSEMESVLYELIELVISNIDRAMIDQN